MANVYLKDTTLKSIGNAIREKTGSSDLLLPGDMPNAIASIVAGGGGGSLIMPENGDKVCQLVGTTTSEQFTYLGSQVNPDNVKLITFYTSPYKGSYADYNTGFFYIPGICHHWVDWQECHNYSLIAVGTASTSRYAYGGCSFDLTNGYSYCYSENKSYPMEYCYLCIDPTSNNMMFGCTYSQPVGPLLADEPDFAFSNADVNFESVLSYRGPFVIIS